MRNAAKKGKLEAIAKNIKKTDIKDEKTKKKETVNSGEDSDVIIEDDNVESSESEKKKDSKVILFTISPFSCNRGHLDCSFIFI